MFKKKLSFITLMIGFTISELIKYHPQDLESNIVSWVKT